MKIKPENIWRSLKVKQLLRFKFLKITVMTFFFSKVNNTDDDTTRILVFEVRIGMNEFDHRILAQLKQQQRKVSGLNGDSNSDLCDAIAVNWLFCGLIMRLIINPQWFVALV